MTWTTVFLVCFWLGFLLSAVSWLLGAFLPHLPHAPHFAHGGVHGPHATHASHAPHARGALVRGGGQPSAFNFSTATAYLAWFGGAGYLLSRYTTVSPLVALAAAAAAGGAGASVVFWFMAKVLWSPNENLDPDDYELVGLIGTVSVPIREGGTGEILFSQAGARRVAGARSDDGQAIAKGVEVVITRYQHGLAYVRTWSDLTEART
jgi:membrane protein implicated in regulation of membrane protease activity